MQKDKNIYNLGLLTKTTIKYLERQKNLTPTVIKHYLFFVLELSIGLMTVNIDNLEFGKENKGHCSNIHKSQINLCYLYE